MTEEGDLQDVLLANGQEIALGGHGLAAQAIRAGAGDPRVALCLNVYPVGRASDSEADRDAQRRIDRTERLVKQIDQRRLLGDQHQNLLTVQSFLVKAREALSEKDVQRALTLADKAFLLAEELVKVVR